MNEQQPQQPAPISDVVQDHIRRATAVLATGATTYKAANTIGVPRSTLLSYRRAYRDLWNRCLDQAKQAAVAAEPPKAQVEKPWYRGDADQQRAKTEDRRHRGPSDQTRENIIKATSMVANGQTIQEAAVAMGVTTQTVLDYSRRHKALWDSCLQAAGGRSVKVPAPKRIPKITQDRIATATRMIAAGHTVADVGKKLGISVQAVGDYSRRWPALWKAALDTAGEYYAGVVQQVAGTEKVMDDPTTFWRSACAAEKWAESRGEQLFPTNGKATLCSFFRDYYEPTVMQRDNSKGYRKLIEISLKRWRLITGDPPLEEIDNQLIAKFRDFLFACRSMGRGEHLATATVSCYLRTINMVLQKAGPAGPRNRDAAGVLDHVPWARLPRIKREIPKIVNEQTIRRMYDACEIVVTPRIPGVKPCDWWRALIVIAWTTAARRRTLFELEWEDFRPAEKCLNVPGERLKSGRPQVFPLTDLAVEHLERIRTDRRLVFPWPMNIRQFHIYWNRLLWEAGIPKAEAFGLHALRRTALTRLAHHSLAAAQLLGGHRNVDITVTHYIDPSPIISKAIQSMPQTEIFGGKPGGNGEAKPPKEPPSMPAPAWQTNKADPPADPSPPAEPEADEGAGNFSELKSSDDAGEPEAEEGTGSFSELKNSADDDDDDDGESDAPPDWLL